MGDIAQDPGDAIPPADAELAERERRRAKMQAAVRRAPHEFHLDPVPGYSIASRRGANRRDLVIVFSAGPRFSLLLHDFGRDVVYLADQNSRYYLEQPVALANSLLGAVDRGGYERVLFSGSSKGGFGALLLADICAPMRPERTFHAVAFNGQARLFPPNPNVPFKSYKAMLGRVRTDRPLAANLERYGDVSLLGDHPNLKTLAIYASNYPPDVREAKRLKGPNVTLKSVVGSFHATMFYFVSKGKEPAAIAEHLTRLYGHRGDADLEQTRPDNLDQMVAEIMAELPDQPELNELYDQLLALRPSRPPAAGRFARRLRRQLVRRAIMAAQFVGSLVGR